MKSRAQVLNENLNLFSMITSNFNTDLNILEVYYEGILELNDLTDFWNKVYTNESMPRTLNVLVDATKAKYNIDTNEFPKLFKAVTKHASAFELIKAAFVQNKPKETAYSMLLEQQLSMPNYQHAVFATRKAALNWLIS